MTSQKIISIIICLLSLACKNPQAEETRGIENTVSMVQTDAAKYNLQGPVKNFRAFYTYNFEANNEKTHYKSLIDFTLPGYYTLNREGFFTKRVKLWDSISEPIIDTLKKNRAANAVIYIFNKGEYDKKSQITWKKKAPYPVINPYAVQVNQRSYQPYRVQVTKDSSLYKYLREYIYTFNINNLPIKQELFIGKDDNEDGILTESKSLDHTITYQYNEKDQVIAHHYRFDKEILGSLRFEQESIDEFSFYIDDEVRYEFSYDDKENVKEVSFYVNDQRYKKEIYTYNKLGQIRQVELRVLSSRSFYSSPRDYIIQEYDSHGNISKATTYLNNGDIYNERFYEYEYDVYNNWTQCRMYLDGVKTTPPTVVGNRMIEYYEK